MNDIDRQGTATELLSDLWENHNCMIGKFYITPALTRVLINSKRPADYVFKVKLENNLLLVW